jgi:hypothetical protein
VCVRTDGREESLDSPVLSEIAEQSDGELRVGAAQLARGEDGHLEVPPQAVARTLGLGLVEPSP